MLNGVDGAYVTLVDDDNSVADCTYFGENVRAENYGMLLFEVFDNVSYFNDLIRVKSYRRLVQNEKFRVAEQSLSESDTLLVTFGKVAYQLILNVLYLEQL